MKCNECVHLVAETQKGFCVTRCELGKGITWDRYTKTYDPAGYCGEVRGGIKV